ncbi:MAG: hypothetical protein ACJAVE_000233 [Polaribacter sp.]|jgi:hypothetical protein
MTFSIMFSENNIAPPPTIFIFDLKKMVLKISTDILIQFEFFTMFKLIDSKFSFNHTCLTI